MAYRWMMMKDYPAVAALAGVSVEEVRNLMFPKLHSGIVLTDDDGVPAAFVVFKIGKKSVEIYALDAAPPCDERLLQIVEDIASGRGKSAVRTNVPENSSPEMLRRLNTSGYLAFRLLPDHYGEGIDGYRFQKLLKPMDSVAIPV